MNCLICNCDSTYLDIVYNKDLFLRFFYLSHLCNLSYSKNEDIDDNHKVLFELTKSRIFIENEDTDAQCYIFYSQKTIYICFRGTSSIYDALIDLSLFQTGFIDKKMKIHKGFNKQFMSLKDEIAINIAEILENNKNITNLCFTGHSLGGALATVASLWFKNIHKSLIVECTTFGSPRVGNKEFVKCFKKTIDVSYRVVNNDDPIQYVPMSPFYYHVDNSYCVKDKNVLIKRPLDGYKRIFNTLKNLKYSNIVQPHRCDTYSDFFENKIDGK